MRPSRPLSLLAATATGVAALAGLAAWPAAAASTTVVISEVYGGGGNSGAPYRNDFIELYNLGSSPVDMSTLAVQYFSSGGNSGGSAQALSGTLQPGHYYLVQEAPGSNTAAPALPTPDNTPGSPFMMSASSGRVDLTGASGVLDRVGYGTATTAETSPAPAASNTMSVSRTPVTSDTDDNSKDFTTGSPTPMNSGSTGGGGGGGGQPGALRIHDIQGNQHLSPDATQSVTDVPGVVTAVRSTGFYLEDPSPDSDPKTSEGIFVFTGSTGSKPATGASVLVSGTVTEFNRGASTLDTTEITNPTFTAGSDTTALPAPVDIGPGGRQAPAETIFAPDGSTPTDVEAGGRTLDLTKAIDFYESLEGMRVTFNGATATGPSRSSGPAVPEVTVLPGEGPNAGQATESGQRTPRGGVIYNAYDHPNTRRLILDDEVLKAQSQALPVVNAGAVFSGQLTGVLEYDFTAERVQLLAPPTVQSNATQRQPAPAAQPGQVSIGSINVENLDPQEPQSKFDALADEIVNAIGAPDIVGLQEIQDNDGATNNGTVAADQTYTKLINAIRTAGGPSYSFSQIDPVNDQDGGEPGGNIRVGFLYRTDGGVTLAPGTAGGSTEDTTVTAGPGISNNPGRIKPTDQAWNSSRKPLVAQFSYLGRPLFVIDNHFNSKGGDAPLLGRTQPQQRSSETQRVQQATIVNGFVKDLLAQDANADVVVIGDLNDYPFSPALRQLEDGGVLQDQITGLPAAQQYNYVFDGNSQVLDHVLVSPHLQQTAGPQFAVARVNAEFADQVSDHEPEVVRLFGATPTPVVPEAPLAALLPLLAAGGAVLVVARRRRRA